MSFKAENISIRHCLCRLNSRLPSAEKANRRQEERNITDDSKNKAFVALYLSTLR